MNFETIDLTVLMGSKRRLWVSASSRMGAVNAVPRIGGDWDIDAVVSQFADIVASADRDPEGCKDIGSKLCELLFGDDEIRVLFQHTRGAAADRGYPLLIRVLGAPHDAAGLPWELTLDPEGGAHEFLALAPDAHLVRLARVRTYPTRTSVIEPPLHVLMVLSSPTIASRNGDALAFDLYEEKRSMLDELAPMVDAGHLTVDVEDHPTLENLRRRVSGRMRGYHLVHYLGHALPGRLVLENETGREQHASAAQFVEMLQSCPDLRLVLYAGCETARSPEQQNSSDWHRQLSIADLTVRVAAPAVVGMQALLPFRTERLFARFFYRALASGRSLADATQLARLAVRGDEFVGGDLLDWAVPTLFVGGADPGAMLDPNAPRKHVDRPPKYELKLDLEEGEQAAFARPVALRQAIDVLSGRDAKRSVIVTGDSAVRRPFIDRVLVDVDGNELTLYLRAARLFGDEDAVLSLCKWLAELLKRQDGQERKRDEGWRTGADWWSRLIEEIVVCPALLAIDDADELSPEAAADLARALAMLAQRRTRTRVMVSGETMPSAISEGMRGRSTSIALGTLPFEEVFRWIRRNRPVLWGYGEDALRSAYEQGLVDDLDAWSQLARELLTTTGKDPSQLERMARSVLKGRRPQRATTSVRPPLRAALANPEIAGRVEQFAAWMTALATDNKVGGQVLEPGQSNAQGGIAELVPVPSPFSDTSGTTTDADLVNWIIAATTPHVDVLLLDYGSPAIESEELQALYRKVQDDGVLLIAAGGNEGSETPQYPAFHPNILAVGALGPDGKPTEYSTWNSRAGKPEIFAYASLASARAAELLPEDREGTSFSGLAVMAAALLVWSVDRSLTAQDVQSILLETATADRAVRQGKRRRFRKVNVTAAVQRARRELFVREVRDHGPAGSQELLAATGLPPNVGLPILDDLVEEGGLTATGQGRGGERFKLSEAGTA